MEAICIVEMEVLIRFQIDILNGTAILRAFGHLSNNRRGFLCPLSSPGQRSHHILSRQTDWLGSWLRNAPWPQGSYGAYGTHGAGKGSATVFALIALSATQRTILDNTAVTVWTRIGITITY